MEKPDFKNKKNILYTGFGDKGTTTLFHCDQGRISKSANIIEALGSLDELNAYLGIVKVYAYTENINIKLSSRNKKLFSEIINDVQQTLFVIQAEIAGSSMTVKNSELKNIENIISFISDVLPPITSFTVSGGSILSAELDFSRTLARRCERRVVAVGEEGKRKIGNVTIAYLNRLSSLLFAMSRYSNYSLSIPEEHPKYNK